MGRWELCRVGMDHWELWRVGMGHWELWRVGMGHLELCRVGMGHDGSTTFVRQLNRKLKIKGRMNSGRGNVR